jgi:hypothetical protein
MIIPIRKHDGQNIFINPSEHHSAEHFRSFASGATGSPWPMPGSPTPNPDSWSLTSASLMPSTTTLADPRFRNTSQNSAQSPNHPPQSAPSPTEMIQVPHEGTQPVGFQSKVARSLANTYDIHNISYRTLLIIQTPQPHYKTPFRNLNEPRPLGSGSWTDRCAPTIWEWNLTPPNLSTCHHPTTTPPSEQP